MWRENLLASSEVENVATLILQSDDGVDDQWKNNYEFPFVDSSQWR